MLTQVGLQEAHMHTAVGSATETAVRCNAFIAEVFDQSILGNGGNGTQRF